VKTVEIENPLVGFAKIWLTIGSKLRFRTKEVAAGKKYLGSYRETLIRTVGSSL
jgi:hypothetical protein